MLRAAGTLLCLYPVVPTVIITGVREREEELVKKKIHSHTLVRVPTFYTETMAVPEKHVLI